MTSTPEQLEPVGSVVSVSPVTDPDVRITTLRSLEELAELKAEWRSLLGESITTDPDYYQSVLDSEAHVLGPYVLTLRRKDQLEAMLIGRVEEIALPCKLGYKTVYAPRVRSITVVYEGYLGKIDDENAALFIEELQHALGRGEGDVIFFRHLDLRNPLYEAATTLPSFLSRQHAFAFTPCWSVVLPASREEFLGSLSKKTRSGVNRYENRLKRDYGDVVNVKVFSGAEEMDELFEALETVASKTYQRGLGAGFRDDERQRTRTALSMEHGWFRAWVLYVGDLPVAFWPGEAYRGRFRSGIPGYDPAYDDYRVGTSVLVRMIADLCEDPSITLLDFGFGDAEYKRRFANQRWDEGDVLIYASRFRTARINVTRTALLRTTRAAMALAGRLGVFGKIKNRWRARLRAAPER
jgi:hypothetical protein